MVKICEINCSSNSLLKIKGHLSLLSFKRENVFLPKPICGWCWNFYMEGIDEYFQRSKD